MVVDKFNALIVGFWVTDGLLFDKARTQASYHQVTEVIHYRTSLIIK